jgi:hypothetical protein
MKRRSTPRATPTAHAHNGRNSVDAHEGVGGRKKKTPRGTNQRTLHPTPRHTNPPSTHPTFRTSGKKNALPFAGKAEDALLFRPDRHPRPSSWRHATSFGRTRSPRGGRPGARLARRGRGLGKSPPPPPREHNERRTTPKATHDRGGHPHPRTRAFPLSFFLRQTEKSGATQTPRTNRNVLLGCRVSRTPNGPMLNCETTTIPEQQKWV